MSKKNKLTFVEMEIEKVEELMMGCDLTTKEGATAYQILCGQMKGLMTLRQQDLDYAERSAKLKKLYRDIERDEEEADKKWYERLDPTAVVTGIISGCVGLTGTALVINYERDHPFTLKNAMNRANSLFRK